MRALLCLFVLVATADAAPKAKALPKKRPADFSVRQGSNGGHEGTGKVDVSLSAKGGTYVEDRSWSKVNLEFTLSAAELDELYAAFRTSLPARLKLKPPKPIKEGTKGDHHQPPPGGWSSGYFTVVARGKTYSLNTVFLGMTSDGKPREDKLAATLTKLMKAKLDAVTVQVPINIDPSITTPTRLLIKYTKGFERNSPFLDIPAGQRGTTLPLLPGKHSFTIEAGGASAEVVIDTTGKAAPIGLKLDKGKLVVTR